MMLVETSNEKGRKQESCSKDLHVDFSVILCFKRLLEDDFVCSIRGQSS